MPTIRKTSMSHLDFQLCMERKLHAKMVVMFCHGLLFLCFKKENHVERKSLVLYLHVT